MSQSGAAPTTLHIGLWKTATTMLQFEVFPKFEGCTLLTRGPSDEGGAFRALADDLCRSDAAGYDVGAFRSYLADRAGSNDQPMLISHEAFAGAAFEAVGNRERNAERLHALVPDAQVLLVVRHQRTMFRSLYTYYVQRGGSGTVARVLGNRAPGWDFTWEILCYDALVECYQERFGPDRVKVLAYEQLVNDPQGFLEEIAAFVGVPVPGDANLRAIANRGLSRPSRWVLRHANRLLRRSRFNERPVLGAHDLEPLVRTLQGKFDRKLLRTVGHGFGRSDEARIDALVARYGPSNARLERLTGLDVRALGYPYADPGSPMSGR